jgi:hypothetical protein
MPPLLLLLLLLFLAAVTVAAVIAIVNAIVVDATDINTIAVATGAAAAIASAAVVAASSASAFSFKLIDSFATIATACTSSNILSHIDQNNATGRVMRHCRCYCPLFLCIKILISILLGMML